MSPDDIYAPGADGILRPPWAVASRGDEFRVADDVLERMQAGHFWYRGRHRFLLEATRRHLQAPCEAIDLGCGCGGWVDYAQTRLPKLFSNLSLGDSSLSSLERAARRLRGGYAYQLDLLKLGWRDRWGAVFLLDVLEHIQEQEQALLQIRAALKPQGLLFVTVPALRFFWSYNDEIAKHQRRYDRAGLESLARRLGFEVVLCRYFMFYLSPLLFLSRLFRPAEKDVARLVEKSHRTPALPINWALTQVFEAETPIGLDHRFPWGTSLLAVLRRPGG